MKYLSYAVLVATLICNNACAQYKAYLSPTHLKLIGKDSINWSFNQNFEITPDSCGQSVRYAHFNAGLKKFTGQVKDISKQDQNIILTEGSYNKFGEKDGYFTLHYPNGNLQAKGSFKNDDFDGKWEMYYENGKSKLNFEAHDNEINITDYWDESGHKQVDNGKGKYAFSSGNSTWEGRLLNGKPDGTWNFYSDQDASRTPIASEKYSKGIFKKDKTAKGNYSSSRILLVTEDMLPFVKAERLSFSSTGCNPPVSGEGIHYAHYLGSAEGYEHAINAIMAETIRHYDISHMIKGFQIEGEINDQGFLTQLTSYDAYEPHLANAIINGLKQAPKLVPASMGGHKVNQKIRFSFSFGDGRYYYYYRFGELIDKTAVIAKK